MYYSAILRECRPGLEAPNTRIKLGGLKRPYIRCGALLHLDGRLPKARKVNTGRLARILLDFIFAFGAWGGVFDSLLGFGFFHGFLGFGGALGAGFAALLALLVEHLFAAQEFDEGVVGAVAFAPSGTDDAEVAAVAIAKAGADGVEEFVDGGAGHQVGERLAARGEVSALA